MDSYKKCPQCENIYSDDIIFCLSDGSTLMSVTRLGTLPLSNELEVENFSEIRKNHTHGINEIRLKYYIFVSVVVALSFIAASLMFGFVLVSQLIYTPEESESIEINYKNGDSRIVHNLASRMTIRKSEKVTVRINRKTSDDILRNLEGNGDPELKTVQSISLAKITLKGDEGYFDISLKNGEEEKNIQSDGNTDWYFEVVPKQAGEANLYLNIAVYQQNDAGKRPIKEIPTVKKVQIENDRTGGLLSYFQLNLLAILGMIITLVVGVLAIAEVRAKLYYGQTFLISKISVIWKNKKNSSKQKKQKKTTP